MKKITALSLLFVAVACFGGSRYDQAKQAPNGHAMIYVPTLQCETCAETVKSAAEKVEGVISVSVDLKKKQAHVQFDPAKTSREKIEKNIAAAGYDANDTRRDEKAHAVLPSCCRSPR